MKNFRTSKPARKSGKVSVSNKSDRYNSIAVSLGFKNSQAAINKMGKDFLEYVN